MDHCKVKKYTFPEQKHKGTRRGRRHLKSIQDDEGAGEVETKSRANTKQIERGTTHNEC